MNDLENVKNKVKNKDVVYVVADTVIVFWSMVYIKTKYRQIICYETIEGIDEFTKNRERISDPGNKRENFMK